MRGTAALSSPDARHRQTGSCHPKDRRQPTTLPAASRAPPPLLALFALAPDSAVRAHALAAAVAAYASDSVVLADARAPAVLAGMNVYYWRTWYKAVCGGKGGSEGHVLRDTTSRGLRGRV